MKVAYFVHGILLTLTGILKTVIFINSINSLSVFNQLYYQLKTSVMDKNEMKALISLLDDDDREVTEHVQDKIISLGKSIIPFLEEEWESNFNPLVQKKIEELIHNLQYQHFDSSLQNWLDNESDDLLKEKNC